MEIFDSVEEMSELSSDQKEEIKRRNNELANLETQSQNFNH